MTTPLDMITRALRLLGALSEGETPSGDAASDALTALNQMLDSWSIERLSVYCTQDQVLTWPANERVQTLGPTGDLVGLRPVLLDQSTYYKANTGVSYGLNFINEQQYNGIALKTANSTFPQVIWVNMTMPDVTISLYPVPTQALEFHFISTQELTQFATLAEDIVIPPGYVRALTYNLALELSGEYGIDPLPQVSRIAMTSKRSIKRINNPDDILSMPYDLVARRSLFNIYAVQD